MRLCWPQSCWQSCCLDVATVRARSRHTEARSSTKSIRRVMTCRGNPLPGGRPCSFHASGQLTRTPRAPHGSRPHGLHSICLRVMACGAQRQRSRSGTGSMWARAQSLHRTLHAPPRKCSESGRACTSSGTGDGAVGRTFGCSLEAPSSHRCGVAGAHPCPGASVCAECRRWPPRRSPPSSACRPQTWCACERCASSTHDRKGSKQAPSFSFLRSRHHRRSPALSHRDAVDAMRQCCCCSVVKTRISTRRAGTKSRP